MHGSVDLRADSCAFKEEMKEDERRAREREEDRESDGREVRLFYSREVLWLAAKSSHRRQTRRVSLHGNSYQGN